MAPEQILAWPIALGIYVVVNGVPGLLCPLVPSYRPQKQLRAFLSVSPQTLASSLVRQTLVDGPAGTLIAGVSWAAGICT